MTILLFAVVLVLTLSLFGWSRHLCEEQEI